MKVVEKQDWGGGVGNVKLLNLYKYYLTHGYMNISPPPTKISRAFLLKLFLFPG